MIKKNKIVIGLVLIVIALGIMLTVLHRLNFKENPEPSVLVQISPAKSILMSKNLTIYGTVGFSQEQIKQINIQNESIIQQIFVTQGQKVKKNDPLLLIFP